ncbi:MAG: hypothetical protein FJ293_07080 [Planctomycetes bacterium]|nr:hypothetical protein [Planctomycetota bacterium]
MSSAGRDPDDTTRDEWIARFLDECGEQGDITAFLARHPDAPPSLAATLSSVARLGAAFPTPQPTPTTLGDWQLHEELGRGGTLRPVLDDLIAHAPDDRVLGALTRARRKLKE